MIHIWLLPLLTDKVHAIIIICPVILLLLMMPGEIISIQLGHYANFIGTHFWNIQETNFTYDKEAESEINNDILFREGRNYKGHVTYTPRLILADLNGVLNTLPKYSSLYEERTVPGKEQTGWDGDVQLHHTGSVETKNEYLKDLDKLEQGKAKGADLETKLYNLDDKVEVWSDFLRPHFHPKSITVLQDYYYDSESQPFNLFNVGLSSWKLVQDEIENNVRWYAEECDGLQGFNVIADSHDGFGGLCSSFLSHITDEYSSKSVFALPASPAVYPAATPTKDTVRLVNTVFTYESLARQSSMFTPMGLNTSGLRAPSTSRQLLSLNYNEALHYHTSAVLAAAVDSVTLPCRTRSNRIGIVELENSLVHHGRKLVAASLDMSPEQELSALIHGNKHLGTCITPGCDLNEETCWTQVTTVRGIPSSGHAVREVVDAHIQKHNLSLLHRSFNTPLPLKTVAPYPHIFYKQDVKSASVLASLHNTKCIGSVLDTLHIAATRSNPHKFHAFTEIGMESDDFEECFESFSMFRANYKEESDL